MNAIIQAYSWNDGSAWHGRLARVRTETTGETPVPLKP